jgi:hypothetical protein
VLKGRESACATPVPNSYTCGSTVGVTYRERRVCMCILVPVLDRAEWRVLHHHHHQPNGRIGVGQPAAGTFRVRLGRSTQW